jgi:hypothetical protein
MVETQHSATARLAREKRTIEAMMQIYCRAHHAAGSSVCPECQSLYEYVLCRLDRCLFGVEKPTCARCPIHCYKPARKNQIQAVMRYAGRRMLLRHPILALLHVLDGLRKPERDGGQAD